MESSFEIDIYKTILLEIFFHTKFWTFFQFIEVSCPPLKIEHSYIECSKTKHKNQIVAGSVCHISCNQGYELNQPDKSDQYYRCFPDSKWHRPMPVCEGFFVWITLYILAVFQAFLKMFYDVKMLITN